MRKGEYRLGEVSPSHAPSMDIQVASNFERFLFHLLDGDPTRVREAMTELEARGSISLGAIPAGTFRASRMDDAGIRDTIGRVWKEYGCLVDPHTACGLGETASDRPRIVLGTAHPAKFPDVVLAATGVEPRHPSLEALKGRPLRRFPLPARPDSIKDFIASNVGSAQPTPARAG